MAKKLPSRPDLDHLRRQAKALLASLEAGQSEAIGTFRDHLPAARNMTDEQVRRGGFRLADAQSAIARKSGFDAWPQLSRHIEQLRSLEGTWTFERLEVDGSSIPAAAVANSHLLIDGDRFRTESPEATYEGVFNIDVEATPHRIDIEFIAGPEAGNWNHGIFRLAGDTLELCLDVNGKPSPSEFRTQPGCGHACETLKRSTPARPPNVTGGDRAARASKPPKANSPATPAQLPDQAGFAFVPSPTLTKLQGEWAAVKLVREGQELPSMMLSMGRRTATGNEIQIRFGGQLMIHSLVRINENSAPMQVDYYSLLGPSVGAIQMGIMEWQGDVACFCMAPAGRPRPTDFASTKENAHTLSHWTPQATKATTKPPTKR